MWIITNCQVCVNRPFDDSCSTCIGFSNFVLKRMMSIEISGDEDRSLNGRGLRCHQLFRKFSSWRTVDCEQIKVFPISGDLYMESF